MSIPNLIIAEKPQLGKAIADALPGCAETGEGVIKKGDYTIVWAYGHLLTLKEPEDFNEKYKHWSMEDLPIYFKPWGLKIGQSVSKKAGQQTKAQRVRQIGELIKQADRIIHAGDVDEEGQLLIDELLRWFHYKGPVLRLDTSNTAVPALQKALKNMKDNKECEADGWSAFGRELSDAIFGFNLSRYFTAKNNTRLTVGRVQTPTLGLVVRRDAQIEGHEKTLYYELYVEISFADSTKVLAKYVPNADNPSLTDGKFLNPQFLANRAKELVGKSFSNVMISKETSKEPPPLPFNLTKLTTYCSKRWGYNPDDVMKITQSLRDKYKAITYNRSDCQYLSTEHYREAPKTVTAASHNLGIDPSLFDTTIKSRCFNDDNITAHFAIIPTSERVDFSSMSGRERNVYTAISHFYLVQFLPSAEKEKTKLFLDLGNGESLTSSSTIIIQPGYRAFLTEVSTTRSLDEDDSEVDSEPSTLSGIPKGIYDVLVSDTAIKEKETRPPSHYTQATLAEDMTRIAKYIDNPEIKKLLLTKDKDKKGENGSIGTSATRPAIINGLIEHGYLTEKAQGKRVILISTQKGRDFYQMLPNEIKTADVTAKWWSIQEDIKTGAATPESMAEDVLETVRRVIRSGAGTMHNATAYASGGTGVILGLCPICGNVVIETAKAYACNSKDCNCVFFKDNKFLKSLGKRMTAPLVRKLLANGEVLLKNCTSSKTGKTFDCILKVTYGDRFPHLSVSFDVPISTDLGKCPKCGGDVRKNKFGNYSCSNWKQGCKFTINGVIAGKKLTDKNIRDLLSKNRTPELYGFQRKNGSKFDAKLIITPDFKIGFQFVDHPRKR